MSSIKQEVHNLSQCCQRRTDRVTAISNTGKTFGEDRTYSIGDMLADRHTNIQNTDKQTRSYQISIFRHPYRERSNYDIFIFKYTDLVQSELQVVKRAMAHDENSTGSRGHLSVAVTTTEAGGENSLVSLTSRGKQLYFECIVLILASLQGKPVTLNDTKPSIDRD